MNGNAAKMVASAGSPGVAADFAADPVKTMASLPTNIPTVNDPASSQALMTGEVVKPTSYEMDFDFSTEMGLAKAPKAVMSSTPLNNLHAASLATAPQRDMKSGTSGPNIIDFDLSALSLDLNSGIPGHHDAPAGAPASDPWATKLALAKEFQHIGDHDSARKLLQEVANGGGESAKAEAKKILTGLA